MLKELGKKEDVFGLGLLSPIDRYQCNPCREPDQLPKVPEGHSVICGYNQGLGERLIVCETLEDMKKIWGSYAKGFALAISWYSGPDPGFIHPEIVRQADCPGGMHGPGYHPDQWPSDSYGNAAGSTVFDVSEGS